MSSGEFGANIYGSSQYGGGITVEEVSTATASGSTAVTETATAEQSPTLTGSHSQFATESTYSLEHPSQIVPTISDIREGADGAQAESAGVTVSGSGGFTVSEIGSTFVSGGMTASHTTPLSYTGLVRSTPTVSATTLSTTSESTAGSLHPEIIEQPLFSSNERGSLTERGVASLPFQSGVYELGITTEGTNTISHPASSRSVGVGIGSDHGCASNSSTSIATDIGRVAEASTVIYDSNTALSFVTRALVRASTTSLELMSVTTSTGVAESFEIPIAEAVDVQSSALTTEGSLRSSTGDQLTSESTDNAIADDTPTASTKSSSWGTETADSAGSATVSYSTIQNAAGYGSGRNTASMTSELVSEIYPYGWATNTAGISHSIEMVTVSDTAIAAELINFEQEALFRIAGHGPSAVTAGLDFSHSSSAVSTGLGTTDGAVTNNIGVSTSYIASGEEVLETTTGDSVGVVTTGSVLDDGRSSKGNSTVLVENALARDYGTTQRESSVDTSTTSTTFIGGTAAGRTSVSTDHVTLASELLDTTFDELMSTSTWTMVNDRGSGPIKTITRATITADGSVLEHLEFESELTDTDPVTASSSGTTAGSASATDSVTLSDHADGDGDPDQITRSTTADMVGAETGDGTESGTSTTSDELVMIDRAPIRYDSTITSQTTVGSTDTARAIDVSTIDQRIGQELVELAGATDAPAHSESLRTLVGDQAPAIMAVPSTTFQGGVEAGDRAPIYETPTIDRSIVFDLLQSDTIVDRPSTTAALASSTRDTGSSTEVIDSRGGGSVQTAENGLVSDSVTTRPSGSSVAKDRATADVSPSIRAHMREGVVGVGEAAGTASTGISPTASAISVIPSLRRTVRAGIEDFTQNEVLGLNDSSNRSSETGDGRTVSLLAPSPVRILTNRDVEILNAQFPDDEDTDVVGGGTVTTTVRDD